MKVHFISGALVLGVLVALPGLLAAQQEQSKDANEKKTPVQIFDGKSLEGWSGDSVYWSVADGAIVGQTTADEPLEHNTFLVWQGGEVGDFELELEIRIESGNSGIQVRSVAGDDHRVTGYQADIDAENRHTGIIYEEGGRGILVNRARHTTIDADGEKAESDEATCDEAALLESLNRDQWHQCRVVAEGSRLTYMINGFVTARLDDGETGKVRQTGVIALQLHTGPPMKVEFRNVRLSR